MYQAQVKDLNNNIIAVFTTDEKNISELQVYYRDQKTWETVNSIIERESMKSCNDVYFECADNTNIYTFEDSLEIAWDILYKITKALYCIS